MAYGKSNDQPLEAKNSRLVIIDSRIVNTLTKKIQVAIQPIHDLFDSLKGAAFVNDFETFFVQDQWQSFVQGKVLHKDADLGSIHVALKAKYVVSM